MDHWQIILHGSVFMAYISTEIALRWRHNERDGGWVNNREAGDSRLHHAHYDVIVIIRRCSASLS